MINYLGAARSWAGVPGRPEGAGTDDAIRALVSLGYTAADAEKAVRAAIDAGAKGVGAAELIRAALGKIGGR
jgi:Holliday junction resolvasome RuvABC DNA-binding subunit